MPYLSVKGMQVEDLVKVVPELKKEIVRTTSCKEEHVKFEYIDVKYIDETGVMGSFPKIEVTILPRNQEVLDEAAKEITRIVQGCGYDFVEVIFRIIQGANLYENGVHY